MHVVVGHFGFALENHVFRQGMDGFLDLFLGVLGDEHRDAATLEGGYVGVQIVEPDDPQPLDAALLYERGDQGGTVHIRTGENEDVVYIIVEDDGVGFNVNAYHFDVSSGKRDSTGLKNISFRLEKTMNASVTIQSNTGDGTKVMITIPREKKCS